ncbi:hypothetical protein H2198_007666 [Neophaeococcomyces mojaviensis]|uniref:Uncharacterized protein n=1 Tax=Neophaeococcomyces mojaviensis TaxID=3383035 RepID=A0ACC2ZZC2_9EURO|nr:hypothetical protein H2198_007666 [Knufia sp. JES_112]
MIRNTVVNTVNYFYPLGNTPPVSLTQDLPFGKDADVLLLGCGDARNILFTCFTDPERKLDITCCDIEPMIIARNILLYSLLIDDIENAKLEQIWNIYYHWKLDDESLALLEYQTEKLLSLSKTTSEWRASAYGRAIRFCDGRTVAKVRKLWGGFSTHELTAAQRSQRLIAFRNNIEKAKKMRQEMVGEGMMFAGIRSAAPTGILALGDFSAIATRWWSEGVTSSGKEPNSWSSHLNPAFLSSVNQSLSLHYGIDPLLGFPLATAYVPLMENCSVYVKNEGLSSADYLLACAHQHFRCWAMAFRKTVSEGTNIRFCVADALALSVTLRNATSQEGIEGLTANLFRDNWTAELLVLDEAEYAMSKQSAPQLFDIIDTSNLIDHLGSLNLIPACAAILKNEMCSTVYTESLVQQDSSEKERITSLLGADIRTIALLLGLSPCEIWTNATNSPEDESILDALSSRMGGKKPSGSTQVRSRLRWKRTYSSNENESMLTVHVETSQAARLLVKLYDHMFEYENIQSLFMNINPNSVSKRANPYYNRASFILLLKSIQRTTTTNWSQCLDQMMSQIVSGFSHSPCGANFAQELFLYMHMLGVDTNRLPTIDLDASKNAKMAPFFRTWPDIPSQVCVTTRVPRAKLQVFTSRAATTIGTPALRCEIEGGGVRSRPWSNAFASVHVAFGDAQLSEHDGVPILQIREDDSSWWGSSDMFVSIFIPTWIILQPDGTTPVVRCGLLSTPQSSQAFFRDLGLTLHIFSTELTSENVIVSRYMPASLRMPRLVPEEPFSQPQSRHIVNAAFSSEDTAISKLSQKISYTSPAAKAKLHDPSVPVQVHFQDALRASIKIGEGLESPISFPVPVDQTRYKVRIARKSSYVEIEAPPWNPLTETSLCLLFPVAPPGKPPKNLLEPAPWTATQVKLDILPVVNLEDKKRMKWLITHASMMFSTKERQIREAGIAGRIPPGTKPNNRVEMKEGLFSMLMAFTDLQGQHASIFGLSKEVGGINVLLLPSCLRLDLINRTVVLDVAAVPLTNVMNGDAKVRSFYENLTSKGVMQIRVSDEELRCWKSVLPAFAERCRFWKHTPNCEYVKKGEVPINKGLDDGHSPLCSCGIGKFPATYLRNLKLNNLEHVLRRYATRVAISPLFAAPYVEDCFLAGMTLPVNHMPASAREVGCGNCGRAKRKDADSGKEELLVCSRCKKRKYCSAECQKADWKSHRGSCSSE